MTAPDHPAGCGLVVVNFGSHRLLERNLIGRQPPGTQVVIVDNLHSAAERTAVTTLCEQHGWELVPRPNDGFGAGVNAGVERAAALGCATVVVLNPDAVADAGTIAALRDRVDERPGAIVSPWVVTPAGQVEFSGARLYLRDGRIRSLRDGRERLDLPRRLTRGPQLSWLSGACFAVRCDLFARLGGFDTGYFLYWEDLDLSYRACRAGADLIVAAELRIVHDEGGTQEERVGRAKSSAYYRYNARNRLVFAARRLDRPGVLRWIAHTPAVSWEILMRGGRRQLVQSPRPLLAVLRGTAEGLAVAFAAVVRGRHGRRRLGRLPGRRDDDSDQQDQLGER